jgi:two-component system sensor histidine kinase CreC
VAVPLRQLVAELLQAQAARLESAQLKVENLLDDTQQWLGERFLLQQALANLLDNALDFTPEGGRLCWTAQVHGAQLELCLFNQTEAIPDYALLRLTERFYSLPRPKTGRKSSGLGLNFVQEVASLHGGTLSVANVPGGVKVRLSLPRG